MRRAFTLIELIVVISIVALISGASVLSLSLLDPGRADTDAKKVQLLMLLAREYSLNQNDDFIVSFQTHRITIYPASDSTDLIRNERLASTITTPLPPFELTFQTFSETNYTAGKITTTNQDIIDDKTITLSYKGKQKVLCLNLETGNISIE